MKLIYSFRSTFITSLLFSFIILNNAHSQGSFQRFFTPSDTLNKNRIWLAGSFALTTYSVFSIGLYNAWYSKNKQTSFHFFNDFGEWYNLDKAAHSYNSYIQSSNVYDGARWCGYSEKSAIIWGACVSTLFQSTIEVMDGFSPEYGFSLPDMEFNILGTGLFASQQLAWHDQKFKLKLSAYPKNYPDGFITGDKGTIISYKQRAKDLYGSVYFTSFLKDYNAQTFWLSFNPGFFSESINNFWPKFLDLSVGYGVDNLYGGYKNEWTTNGEHFSANSFQRYQQYYLSLDINLKKIQVENKFLQTVLHVLNIFKIPAPALELNSLGKTKWHWLFF